MDSVLIYGKTDTGKTTLLGETARYLVSLGLKGRLVSADSGWGPFGDLVLPGNGVEAFDLTAFVTPSPISQGQDVMATLNAVSDGAWFVQTDGGYKLRKAPLVDFYIFEGLKSFADLLMQSHVRAGRQIAEDVVGKFTVAIPIGDQNTIYASGQPGRAHYNHVQKYLLSDWWPRTKALRTKLIIVTTHEAEGDDDISGKSTLGPALIGRASVASITQIFQDSLHLVKHTKLKDNQLLEERRMYYKSHPQMITETAASSSQVWPAKVSLTMQASIEFTKRFPGGFLPFNDKEGLQPLLELRGYKPGMATVTTGASVTTTPATTPTLPSPPATAAPVKPVAVAPVPSSVPVPPAAKPVTK